MRFSQSAFRNEKIVLYFHKWFWNLKISKKHWIGFIILLTCCVSKWKYRGQQQKITINHFSTLEKYFPIAASSCSSESFFFRRYFSQFYHVFFSYFLNILIWRKYQMWKLWFEFIHKMCIFTSLIEFKILDYHCFKSICNIPTFLWVLCSSHLWKW